MSLEHILLGMLAAPKSGYDLKNEFESGARYFWAADFSQIYPTLKRMEQRGWLSSRLEPSDKGPPRRLYRRTAAGRNALFQWLRREPLMGTERFAYIGQLIYMAELDDLNATREFLLQLRHELAARAAVLRDAYRATQSALAAEYSPVAFHELLAIRIGTAANEGRSRACEACLKMIEHRLQEETIHA